MKKHTHLSEEELSIFLEYSKKNQVLFKNKIIQNYFTTDKNKKYLVLSLKGNFENRQALEESFRKHFFQYRFTKYLSSVIKFHFIDLMRIQQRYNKRYLLVLDNHVIESNTILGEESFCCSERSSHKNDNGNYHFDFKNEQLELLFNSLTEKQQTITTLSYGLCLKDYEIGRLLNITQQAVSKTRNLIIKRLRRSISEKAL